MVRRRLNKRVAFLGSVLFIVIVLSVIIVVLQLDRDPQEFIKDAQAAIQTARQSTDPKVKDEYYGIAVSKYSSAFRGVTTNDERKEILFDTVDLFIETENWPYVLDSWDKILRIEPDNINALYGRLRYFEELGNSGIPNVWKQTYDYASGFLDIAQKNNLMNTDMSALHIDALNEQDNGSKQLGAYLYLVKGKSAFEQVSIGAVTNPEEVLEISIADLNQSKDLEPNNIDVYLNLAKAILTKGEIAEIKGSPGERKKAEQEVLSLLEQSVNNAEDKIKANINLINFKVILARESEPEQIIKQFKSLESEYESLVNRYDSSALVYEALSQFYSIYSQYTKLDASRQNLDKSIDAISHAMELDENNVVYAIQITDLYYRRFSIYKNEPDLTKAIELAKNALSWPDAQNTTGPGNNVRIRNKYMLNTFLANSYIEQILYSPVTLAESDKNALLGDAQKIIHEIEMIIGTTEDPTIVKWNGMLDLAKGNTQEAIKKLNKAYEQFKAVKPAQPPWPMDLDFARLSYTLARLFMNSEEVGKLHEYLLNAHYSGITEIKPEARLDYVDVILRFNRFTDAIDNIKAFEEDYGPSKRSQQLRAWTYIYSGQYEDAQSELDKMPASDAETINIKLALAESQIQRLQMSLAQNEKLENANTNGSQDNQQKSKDEIKKLTQTVIGLLENLLDTKPEMVQQSSVVGVCRNSILNDQLEQTKQLVEKYLAKFPDNIAINIYKNVFKEPDPGDITQERYLEIEEKTLSEISDPIKRAANLGIFYRRNGEISKAVEQFTKVLDAAKSTEDIQNNPELKNIKLAVSYLLDIALANGKQDIAENILNVAREKNLDDFNGMFFDARITASKQDYKNALIKIDECINERPISSQLYMLRSSINAALGNDYAYMEDITKAANLDPLDGSIAKRLAIALYSRDRNSKNEVPVTQINETRDVMEKAIALNQGDLELLDLYTKYIAASEPSRAIAIRQDILTAVPSMENAIMLGVLATNVAIDTSDPNEKEFYFDIAGSAFEQAKEIDPNNRDMILSYTKYLRAIGRDDQAKQLLEESKDDFLVANDLFQEGDFENARKVLERIYSNEPNNTVALRGLLLVNQELNDKDAVKKYSNEMLAIDNNANNLVMQIKAFITVGLFTDAEHKLQSLKERYPEETNVALLQAWLTFKQGNANKALDIINSYIQDNKNNPAAWQLRSEINIEMNEYARAISDLKTCKSLVNDPSVGISLAKAYIQNSQYEEAEKELMEIKSKSNYPMEVNFLLESIYLKLNRKTALENLYDNVIKQFPDNIQWLKKAGDYAMQTRELERAQKFYKKASDVIRESYTGDKQGKEIDDQLFVNTFDGYLKALLMDTGDIDLEGSHPENPQIVLKDIAKYVDTSYAPLAHLRMTQAYLLTRDEEKAEKNAHLALEKIGPDEKYASKVMQELYKILGPEEIVKKCTQMLEKNPDSLEANYTMYFVLRVLHKYEDSIEYIDKCISLIEKDSPIRLDYVMKKAESLLFAYTNNSDNKYINEAINDYESLLSEMPNNIQVLNNLAYMLAESNQRIPDALKYAEKLQKIKPNDPGFLDTYAFVLLKNGKVNEAEKTMEKALNEFVEQRQMDIPAEVYEHKGMIEEKLGNNEKALASYKRALELGTSYLSQQSKDRINQAIERVSQ